MSTQLIGDVSSARVVASIIDNIIAGLIAFVLVARLDAGSSLIDVLAIVPSVLAYFFVFEFTWGRTPGKLATGLVVQDINGLPCDATQAFVRTITRLIEANPILFGAVPAALVIAASNNNQRWGDYLAGTVVVSTKSLNPAPQQPQLSP